MKKIRIAILCCIAIMFGVYLQAQEVFNTKRINDRFFVTFAMLSQDGGYLVCSRENGSVEINVLSKFDVNGKELWHKDFKDMAIWGGVEMSDGSLICVGPESGEHQYVNMHIIKLTACGEIEWSKVDSGYDYGYTFQNTGLTVVDIGDGLLIPIRSSEYALGSDFVRLIKLDYDGNVLWNRKLLANSGKGNYDLTYSNIDSDGNIVLSGLCGVIPPEYDLDDPTNNVTAGTIVVKVDREGNLLWESLSHRDFDVYGVPWNDPLIDHDNSVFTTNHGWLETNYGSYTLSCSSIIRIDKSGHTVANEIVNLDSDPVGGLQLTDGFTWTNDKRENIATVMKYLPEGSKNNLSKKGALPSICDYQRSFNSLDLRNLAKSDDPDIDEMSKHRHRLYVVDKNAKIVNQLDLDDYKVFEYTLFVLRVENDNLLLISDEHKYEEECNIYMRKYMSDLQPAHIDDTERNYDPFCSGEIESGVVDISESESLVYTPLAVNNAVETEKAIRLYPNPAAGSVKLYLSSGLGQKIVDFYDATGRLCKSTTIGEGWAQENVDISELPSGIYFLKLTVDNKVIGNEKLIVK